MEDQHTITAYHEAGHAVVGYALGAVIEHVQIGGAEEDAGGSIGPGWRRFGECRVNWGRVDPHADWQLQRELLTTLAGLVAEQIYSSVPTHPAFDAAGRGDWAQAWERSRGAFPQPELRMRLLEQFTATLRRRLTSEPWWAAVAAVADELLAHELLDAEQTEQTLGFWIGRLRG